MLHPLFRQIIAKHKRNLSFTILVVLVSAAMNAWAGYSLSYFFKVFEVEPGAQMQKMLHIGGFVLIIWLVNLLMLYFSSMMQAKFQQYSKNSFRQLVIERITRKSYEDYAQENSGTYLSWLTNDTKEINERTFVPFVSIFDAGFAVVASFVALFMLDVWISVAALSFFVLTLVVPQLVSAFVEKAAHTLTRAQDETTAQMKDTLTGFPVFYTTNRLNRMIPLIMAASEYLEDKQYAFNKTKVFARTMTVFVSLLAQVGLMGFTVFRAVQGAAPIGAALAVANLAGAFYGNLSNLMQSWITLKASQPIWEKYEEKLETTPSPTETIQDVSQITVDGVAFSYPGSEQVFTYDKLRFDYPKNYAISGASGSGKSTLMKLLAGLYRDFDGEIRLNETSVKDIQPSSLASEVIYMDQQTYLFSGSLRDNLSLYDPNVKDEDMLTMLKRAGLWEFYQGLPDGLDTVLKENAKNISGGQRQRLALARTILLKPRFIIIDEGTSQLDRETAQAIEQFLLDIDDISVLVVSHHFNLNTSAYDKVIRI